MIVLDVNAAIAIAKGTEEGRVLRELMMEGEEVVRRAEPCRYTNLHENMSRIV